MALTDRYRHGATLGSHVVTANESAVTGYMVRVDPAGNKAWVGWDIGDVAMLNGTFLNSRATFGLFPLAFGPRGLYVMHADDLPNRRLSIYDLASRQWIDYAPILPDPLDPAPNPSVGSNGIAYIDPNGRVVMNYYPEVFERTMPNGERWRIIRETASYIVGGYGPPNDPRYGASLSRLHKPSGKVERWLGETPIPHDTLETPDGTLWTFISGTAASPEPDQVVWQDFPEVPVEPPAPKPVLAPLPDGPFPACWIGIQSDHGTGLGNCTWSASPSLADRRPVSESSSYAGTILDRTLLTGLWLSDRNNPPQTVEAEIAYAKAKGASSVYLHEDDDAQADNVEDAARRVRLAGLKAVEALHLYDQPVVAAPDVYTGCTMNLRTVGRNLEQLAWNWEWFVRELKAGRFAVAFLTNVFESEAALDLEVCWPELWEQMQDLLRRIPTQEHLPGWVPPPVVVEPPIVVKPPKPPRPPRPPQPEKPSIFSRKQ